MDRELADRTPILNFSEARDGASSVAVSEGGAVAVGEAASPRSSRPSVKGKKRSTQRAPRQSSKTVDRGAKDRERVVAESLEAESLERERAKSPAQKRIERMTKAAGPVWKRVKFKSKGNNRKKSSDGENIDLRSRKTSAENDNRMSVEASFSGRQGANPANVGRRAPQQKKGQDKDLATAITGALVDAAVVVVEFVRQPHSKGFKRAMTALICFIVAFAFIYPSASDYYVAIRNHDKAQAEYLALQDYYKNLKDQVNYLESDQGVEDRARDEYGMVNGGENYYNIDDLDSESNFDKNPTEIGIIPKGSIDAPETWYTSILDPFFGYEG